MAEQLEELETSADELLAAMRVRLAAG
jgi:hypothetical protein